MNPEGGRPGLTRTRCTRLSRGMLVMGSRHDRKKMGEETCNSICKGIGLTRTSWCIQCPLFRVRISMAESPSY